MEKTEKTGKNKKRKRGKMREKERKNEREKRMIKRVNDAMHKARNRKGLWDTKHEKLEKKYRKYCDECGATNTTGAWQNKRTCTTKSQWQRKQEEQGATEEQNRIATTTKTTETVILYDEDNETFDAYIAEIEKSTNGATLTISAGKRKVKVKAHEKVIDNVELLKTALQNRVSVYVMDYILN